MTEKRFKSILWGLTFLILNSGNSALGNTIEETGNIVQTLSDQTVLEIKGSRNIDGAVHIISSQGGDIRVAFTKYVKASSEAKAKRYIDLIELRLELQDSDKVVLNILSPSHAPWDNSRPDLGKKADKEVQLEVYIELPERLDIRGTAKYLNFDIRGPFKNVEMNCEFSAISLARIYGSVDIVSSWGPLDLQTIKGDLLASTSNAEISARDIIVPSGSAVLKTVNAEIQMMNVQGSIEAYTSHAEIRAKKIDAPDGSIVVRTANAAIDLENVIGELVCETAYAEITIKKSSINHGFSKIETSYAQITAYFDEIDNCDLNISSSYSDVELVLPKEISARLAVTVDKGGKIHTSNLNIRPKLLDPTRLEGMLGDGDSRIEVIVNGIGAVDISGS